MIRIVAAVKGDKEYESLWRNHNKTCGLRHKTWCWANCPNRVKLRTRKTKTRKTN